jgi:hypothetical protein
MQEYLELCLWYFGFSKHITRCEEMLACNTVSAIFRQPGMTRSQYKRR